MQQQQQRRIVRMAERIGVAAAAAAAAASEDDESIGLGSHSRSDSEDHSGSDEYSSGGSDTERAAEQQGIEEHTGGSSHVELGALNAQAQQRKRSADAGSHIIAGSDRNAGSKRHRVGSGSSAAVEEGARTNGNRLPVVELPGGIWRLDGMVSTTCFCCDSAAVMPPRFVSTLGDCCSFSTCKSPGPKSACRAAVPTFNGAQMLQHLLAVS
jgi:hypothetical protein